MDGLLESCSHPTYMSYPGRSGVRTTVPAWMSGLYLCPLDYILCFSRLTRITIGWNYDDSLPLSLRLLIRFGELWINPHIFRSNFPATALQHSARLSLGPQLQ